MPIFVSVRRDKDDSLTGGNFSARIVDVSNHGACLLLTQVMMQSYHIFHSTREDELAELVLHIKVPSQHDTIEIPAQPVWLNATKIDDIKVFKMGVDFMERMDDDLLITISKLIRDA